VPRRRPAGARAGTLAVLALALACPPVHAQTGTQPPQPTERVAFREAIDRAIRNNPSSAIAAAGILRAEALLTQARSAARLQVNGSVTTTTLNRGTKFEDTTVTPQNAVTAFIDIRMPVYAPVAWAQRVEAQDQRNIADLNVTETNRQTAIATADAYLMVIARKRVVDGNTRALETAQAHCDLARQLQEMGRGSLLNQLRAQQEVSTDQTIVEAARLAVYRAQEALGVLLAADGPVDVAEDPDFTIPEDALPLLSQPNPAGTLLMDRRADLRLFAADEMAAERVVQNTTKSYFPSLDAVFQPQTNYPAPFFSPGNSWRFLLQGTIPIFDSGFRRGLRAERQSALDISRATLAGAVTQVSSEVRTARESVASSERFLESARAAADQAQQVVNITNISFRAGGATNIEVIDAERAARDADNAVAVAEDALRRSRLDLLDALGRFP